jgi:5-formyltetrahydrofolate cyclo-ligase
VKTKLRTEKMLKRINHKPPEKRRKDLLIAKKLHSLPIIKKAKTILFYMPIHGEVDLKPFYETTALNKKFILPRVKDETTLHLYHINDLNNLVEGCFKIPEPKCHFKMADSNNIDIVLVPGIVFARNGHRIGYGKGFYDRLLKRIKCPKIGIAYDFQMVENIPGEPHDTPMDMIVTEKEVIKMHKPK